MLAYLYKSARVSAVALQYFLDFSYPIVADACRFGVSSESAYRFSYLVYDIGGVLDVLPLSEEQQVASCDVAALDEELGFFRSRQVELATYDNKPTVLSQMCTSTTLSFMPYPFLLFP